MARKSARGKVKTQGENGAAEAVDTAGAFRKEGKANPKTDVLGMQKEMNKRKKAKTANKNISLVSIQRRGESEKKEGKKVIVDKPYVGLISMVNGRIKEKSNNGWEREAGRVDVLEPIESDYQLRYRRGKREGCLHGFILHKTELPLDEYDFLKRVVREREKINALTYVAGNIISKLRGEINTKFTASLMEIAMRLDHIAVDLEQELNFPQREAEEIEGIYASGNYSAALYLECLKVAGGLEGSEFVLGEAEDVFSKVLKDEDPNSDSLRLAEEVRREIFRYRELMYGSRSENMHLFGIEYGIKPKPKKRKLKEEAGMDAQELEASEIKKEEKKRERKTKAWENTKNRIRKKLREKGHTTQRIRVADLLPVVLEAAQRREKTEKLKAVKPPVKVYPLPKGVRTIPEEPMPDRVKVITLSREGCLESVVVWEGEVERLFSTRKTDGFMLGAPAVVGSSLNLMRVLPERVAKKDKMVDGSVGLTFEGPVNSIDFISLEDFLCLERYYVRDYVQSGIEEGYCFYNEAIDKISRELVGRSKIEYFTDAEGRIRKLAVSRNADNPIKAYRTSIGDKIRSEALTTTAGLTVSWGEERRVIAIEGKYQNVPGLKVLIESLKREGVILGYQKFIEVLTAYEGALRAFSPFYGQQQDKPLELIDGLLNEFSDRFKAGGHKALVRKILGDAEEQCDLITMAFSLAKARGTLEKVLAENYRLYENPVHEYLSRYVSEAVSPEEREQEVRKIFALGRFDDSAIGFATLGEMLMEKGEFKRAKECFEQAIVINDQDPSLCQKLGDCYFGPIESQIERLNWIKMRLPEIDQRLGDKTISKGERKELTKEKKELKGEKPVLEAQVAEPLSMSFKAYMVMSSLIKEEADRLYKLAENKETEAEQLHAQEEEKEGEKVYDESKEHRRSAEKRYESRKEIEELLKGMANNFSPTIGCKFLDYQTWIKLGDCYAESEDWERVGWAYTSARPILTKSMETLLMGVEERMKMETREREEGRGEQAQIYLEEAEGMQREAETRVQIEEELKEKIEEAEKRYYEMRRQRKKQE